MTIGPEGLALIEQFEGCKLQAYQDGNGIWTIGYGHVGARAGQYESQEQAEADLCADLGTAERAVSRFVRVSLNQNQFDALVSFTYNEGAGRLQASTLLRYVNSGAMHAASAQFVVWDIVAGAVSPGLLRRRVAEQALFLEAA